MWDFIDLLKIPCMIRNLSSISINIGTEELLSVVLYTMFLNEGAKEKRSLTWKHPEVCFLVPLCFAYQAHSWFHFSS